MVPRPPPASASRAFGEAKGAACRERILFGGPATWQDAIEVGNRVVEGHWWSTRACPDNYRFALGTFTQMVVSTLKFFFPGVITQVPARDNPPPTCNFFGLLPLGPTLVNKLMDKGAIIDVDHMSIRAFDQALSLAEARNYPVMASHVLSYDLHEQEHRHERMRTRRLWLPNHRLVPVRLRVRLRHSMGGSGTEHGPPR